MKIKHDYKEAQRILEEYLKSKEALVENSTIPDEEEDLSGLEWLEE